MSSSETTTKATNSAAVTPGAQRTALEAAKLGQVQGKTFVITGAYSGIGVETAKALLAQGGVVVVGGRNSKLLDEFVTQLKGEYDQDRVDGHVVDLGDLKSVQTFAQYVQRKNYQDLVLICNAGVMNTPAGHTASGFETQMGVNVVGHFLLAKILVPHTSRQAWVSSLGHTMYGSPRIDIDLIKKYQDDLEGYDGWRAYQQSKLGNILLAKEFDKRYDNVDAASLHPGGIQTNLARHTGLWSAIVFILSRLPELWRNGGGISMKSVEVGASTTVTVATTTNLAHGGYYDDCEIAKESESAKNKEDAKALFDFIDEATKEYQ